LGGAHGGAEGCVGTIIVLGGDSDDTEPRGGGLGIC
jgi:hypothetical protein